MKKKITAIIQARQSSSRFKNKILEKINHQEVILFLINRLKKSKYINDIIVAIPNNKQNDKLYNLLIKNKTIVFRGSEQNVLKRYFECVQKFKIDDILRITSDCPLIDLKILDNMAKEYLSGNFDYFSNTLTRTFPDGMDLEFFKSNTLKIAYQSSILESDKEHVTPYMIRSSIFKKKNFYNKINYSKIRITLDYPSDLQVIRKFINHCKRNRIKDDLSHLIIFYKNNQSIFKNNDFKIKNKINNSDKRKLPQILWRKANEYIAGGNSLFSKRPDLYSKNMWPTYYTRAKGCKILGIDGQNYMDFSNMGVGTNILGYSNVEVDNAVKKRVSKGNMSTLNSIEEIDLAKKLVEMHPWSNKVRFTRSGGEANSLAIRLCRAANPKRQKIAFCGYHGWHDWYLASNLKNKKSLDIHLLAGLNPKGVYSGLKGSVFPFEYNNFKELEKLVKKNKDIGIIKMEVMRNVRPKENFLKKVRKLADKHKIILVFDECTSGFRESYGGMHLKYKINPDVLILGKALGNGYGINAVVGKNFVMNEAKLTFVSSTFWTEASGFTAALKTLEIMKRKKTWEYITNLGKYVKKRWKEISKKNNLKIKIAGIDALPNFYFKTNHLIYKSLITQEMLKNNILATNNIYISCAHNKKNLNKYFKILDRVFKIISKCENNNDDVYRYLHSEISRSDFKRLN